MGGMQRGSALDRMVRRFHDRWETNRQFRSTMSAALAVIILLSLCSCMLATATVTNAALGGILGTGSDVPTTAQLKADTGTGPLKGAASFPTSTVVFTVGPSPAASPIPASGTPPPTATAAPTATPVPTDTPCVSNCGGGGGGGGNVRITVTGWSPATWTGGAGASISVHTSVPNDGVNMIISFPQGTVLSAGTSFSGTDGSGNGTFSFTAAGCSGGGQATALVEAQNGNSTEVKVPCN